MRFIDAPRRKTRLEFQTRPKSHAHYALPCLHSSKRLMHQLHAVVNLPTGKGKHYSVQPCEMGKDRGEETASRWISLCSRQWYAYAWHSIKAQGRALATREPYQADQACSSPDAPSCVRASSGFANACCCSSGLLAGLSEGVLKGIFALPGHCKAGHPSTLRRVKINSTHLSHCSE